VTPLAARLVVSGLALAGDASTSEAGAVSLLFLPALPELQIRVEAEGQQCTSTEEGSMMGGEEGGIGLIDLRQQICRLTCELPHPIQTALRNHCEEEGEDPIHEVEHAQEDDVHPRCRLEEEDIDEVEECDAQDDGRRDEDEGPEVLWEMTTTSREQPSNPAAVGAGLNTMASHGGGPEGWKEGS